MDWSKLLEQILLIMIPILVTPVAAYIAVKAKIAWAKFAAEQPRTADVLHDFAVKAVRAAEQAGLSDLVDDKKSYALSVLDAYLDEYGINIDPVLIDAAIEQAVGEQFNWEDVFPDPDPMTPAA